jgi:Mn2+/Fe2+ NRAMP family transporter
MKSNHALNMLLRLSILVSVAIVGGLVTVWLSGQQYDPWKTLGATLVFLLAVAWFYVRWYVPRQP